MILITGAGGKTGRAVARALIDEGHPVRGLVHRDDQAAVLNGLGVRDVVVGDMHLESTMTRACEGIRAMYHIAPNVNPAELPFGQVAIAAARATSVEHFVFHSVLYPQIREMPHHWRKLQVEEELLASGLAFTILQPAAYMQNISAYWNAMVQEGLFSVPYSIAARSSMVDLLDVAEVAAGVLTKPGHEGATYELVGPDALSASDIAHIVGRQVDREIRARSISIESWTRKALTSGLGEPQIDALTRMFRYYDRHGFVGNPKVLEWLLGRAPRTFQDFTYRMSP